MKTFIGLIPARSGSKGLKDKNLRKVGKSSLLEIAVRNLKNTKFINEVYVTSESKVILQKAKKAGAIPFLRPKKLALDSSKANEVIKNFIIKKKLKIGTIIVYHQPSSPLKSSSHINKSINIFKKKSASCMVSCYEINSEKIFKSFNLIKKKLVPLFNDKFVLKNRQLLKNLYIPNGAIYIFKLDKIFLKRGINFKNTIPYIMKKNDTIDINDLYDFKKAKVLFKK